MTARQELEHLYNVHRGTPFPPSHPDKEVQILHDRLVLYDAEVAGLVLRVLRGQSDAPRRMKEDADLRRQIEAVMVRRRDAADLLAQYLQNYDRLVEMVKLSKSIQ